MFSFFLLDVSRDLKLQLSWLKFTLKKNCGEEENIIYQQECIDIFKIPAVVLDY